MVIEDWYREEENASIIMLWADNRVPGGQAVRVLGTPPVELTEIDGLVVGCRKLHPKTL